MKKRGMKRHADIPKVLNETWPKLRRPQSIEPCSL